MRNLKVFFAAAVMVAGAGSGAAQAEQAYDPANVKAAYSEDGHYFTEDDIPTYNVQEDGTVDWPTYSGFRRYHSECHVCHGPEGEGSSYAPALKKSALAMDYYDFVDVVTNGRQKVNASQNSVMPSFGTNPNVMCYLNDIYVYLKARGTDAVARGRPRKKEPKSDVIREEENACLAN
jgi:methanol metabolism-related c-type cytochrome